MSLLNNNELEFELKQLSNWEIDSNTICKSFNLKNFADAISFVVRIGFEAERLDHHPDLFLHSWNKVKVSLSTHSEGGITKKDIELAKIIDKLA